MAAETRVLTVEDDPALRASIAATLRAAGYRAFEAATAEAATRALAHHAPGLVLLDLGLPDGDGLAFLKTLRETCSTPVVVLSARNAEAVKVAALDAGADDYLTKPFGVDELLARIRAALRHAVQAQGSEARVRTGDLEIDLAARIVRKSGREVELSPKEYELLACLASQLDRVVPHAALFRAAWGSRPVDAQYLRVFVGQLRKKLEDRPSRPRLLLTDPGVGYRLAAVAG